MHVDLYLRQSQDRDGLRYGVERQEEDGRKLIAQRGWTLHRVLTDNDLSASKARPNSGFTAVIADLEAGKVGGVVAWNMARLTRNRRETVQLIEAGQRANAIIAMVRGSDLDMSTPAGRFTADMLASVARHEIEEKSDRYRRAAVQAAQQGRRVGGRRPFGYEADGMTVREDEAALIRAGYAAILAGSTIAALARAWNEAGLHTGKVGWKSGEPSRWTRDSVRLVLLNPRNAGLRRHLGEVVGKAVWPALVDEETYYAARAVITDPARRTAGPGRLGTRLLTGIALCGVCDQTVMAGSGARARRGHDLYRCRSLKHVSRQLDPVEEYVTELVVERLSRPDARDLLVDHGRPDAGVLKEKAHALRERLDSLAVEFADDDDMSPSQLRAATRRLRERLAVVEGELADAGRTDVLGPLVLAEDVRAAWLALDRERQRAAIDALMVIRLDPPGRGKRYFDPATVRIEWR